MVFLIGPEKPNVRDGQHDRKLLKGKRKKERNQKEAEDEIFFPNIRARLALLVPAARGMRTGSTSLVFFPPPPPSS
ncbi:hypothetical protein I7I48_01244 [Histoplasma ohiense]|nr:hypothetical protein I7I48_01244 [Histoplasma ohiense (nom. inval.)]